MLLRPWQGVIGVEVGHHTIGQTRSSAPNTAPHIATGWSLSAWYWYGYPLMSG